MVLLTVDTSDRRLQAFKSSLSQSIAASRYQASEGELADVFRASEMAYVGSLFWAQNVGAVKWKLIDPYGEVVPLPKPGQAQTRKLSMYEEMLVKFLNSPALGRCLYNLEMSYRFFGRALAYRVTNDYSVLKQLQYINPLHYQPIINYADYSLQGFRLSRKSAGIKDPDYILDLDQVFYYSGFSFDDDYDGVSSAEVAFYDAMAASDLSIMERSIFQNMAIPALAIQPAENVGNGIWLDIPGEKEGEIKEKGDSTAFSEFLRENHKGTPNAGKTIITTRRYDYKELSNPALKDMDTGTQKDNFNHSVSMAFQVNYEFFAPGLTTYAELGGKVRIWQEMQFLPHIRDYAQTLTEQIIQPYLTGYTAAIDETNLLYESQDEKQKVVDMRLKNTMISLYDAAQASGVQTPPEWQKTLYYVEGIGYIPETEVATSYKLKFNSAQPAYPETAIPEPTTLPVQSELPEPHKDAPNLFVALSLANNPDLMGLQRQVRSLNPSEECKWNDPNEFHVTLLSAPMVEDTALKTFMDALQVLPVPDLSLKVGSLGSFDAVGEHSMHFAIRLNSALLDYQESVYELAQEHGIATSSYSHPDNYKPHVTVGYSPDHMKRITYRNRLSLTPQGVYAQYGDDTLWKSWQTDDTQSEVIAVKTTKPDSFIERNTYRELENLITYADAGKSFIPNRVSLAVALRAYHLTEVDRLTGGTDTHARLLALKAYYLHVTSGIKSIQSTRLDFEGEIEDLLNAATKGGVSRQAFESALFAAISKYGEQAFRDGMKDAGVDDPELDPDDVAKIERLLADQQQYVASIGAAIYEDGKVTPDEIQGRAVMWFNKSVYPFYAAGIESAASNGVFEWVLGSAEKHCPSCKALSGQRRRFKSWKRRILPKSDKLACKGFLCTCQLVPTDESATRGNFPIWQPELVGAKHDHDHIHEEVTITPLVYAIKSLVGDEPIDWFSPVNKRYELSVTKESA